MKLSIIIPCFNEEATLGALLERVLAAGPEGIEREILVVDDGSTDRSARIAASVAENAPEVRLLSQPRNLGKGAAVRAGLAQATGDVVLVQDADLEYDPADYAALLAPFADPEVGVVYGSRIRGSKNRSYHRYYWGGRLVTWFANLLFGTNLTDEPTGYKVLRRELLESLDLASRGFDFCAETTGKLLRRGVAIREVPIHYEPRSFEEGKKIRWRDGVSALWTLFRCRFF